MAQPEGLRLALARLRHRLGNAIVLTDVAPQKTCHLSQDQMTGALWKSLQETQQLITDVLAHLDQEEREINITRSQTAIFRKGITWLRNLSLSKSRPPPQARAQGRSLSTCLG